MEKRNLHKRFFAVLAVMFLMFPLFLTGATGVTAFAAESTAYTSVLTDLKKDESFSTDKYPASSSNTSLQVIQIAESTDRELLIYTYQPNAIAYGHIATTLRLSKSSDGGPWEDYPLSLLSNWGTLAKYRVNEFEVEKSALRFYNIAAIHREYINGVDGNSTEREIGVEVAQCWTVSTINGEILYSMEDTETVEIKGYKVGTVRYADGHGWVNGYAVDNHFIAFSTDWDIQQLLEADVSYEYAVKKNGVWGSTITDPERTAKTVTYKDKGSTTGGHTWNSKKREWDLIQKASVFADTCEPLSEEAAKDVRKYQWVLCFAQTSFADYTGGTFGWVNWVGSLLGANNTSSCTVVSGVTILRLKFVSDGEVYNLGAVSNKSGAAEDSGSDYKDFWTTTGDKIKNFFVNLWNDIVSGFKKLPWWAWVLIAVAVVAIGLPLLCYFLPAVGKYLLIALQGICKALLWLIMLPVRFVKWIAKKISERKEKGRE